MFILYSARYQGWLNHASWISDFREAQTFDEEKAFEMCRIHRPNLIPVRKDDLVRALTNG